jgi:hypothetical protein
VPRRADRPAFDDFMFQGITLERFGNTLAQRVRGMLDDLYGEMMGDLAEIDPGATPRWRDARLQKLQQIVTPLIQGSYGTILDDMTSDMEVLAKQQWEFLGGIMKDARGKNLLDVALTKADLKALASNTMIEGAPSKDWWEGQAGSTRDKFMREVRNGVLRGESIAQMARRIRGAPTGNRYSWYTKRGQHRWNVEFEGGVLQANTRQAQALARTSVQTVAAQARRDTYLANRDVIKGIEQISTLDNRTTKLCMAYDGEKWNYEDVDAAEQGVSPTAKKAGAVAQAPRRPGKPRPLTEKEFKALADAQWDLFDDDERAALIEWQEAANKGGASYVTINDALRGGMAPTSEEIGIIEHIRQSIAKVVMNNPEMQVYRGASVEALGLNPRDFEAELATGMVGRQIRDSGFMATTWDRELAESFAFGADDVILEIDVPIHGAGVALDETREFLMLDGTTLEIISVDLSGDTPVIVTRVVY